MRLLVDTRAFLWFVAGDRRFSNARPSRLRATSLPVNQQPDPDRTCALSSTRMRYLLRVREASSLRKWHSGTHSGREDRYSEGTSRQCQRDYFPAQLSFSPVRRHTQIFVAWMA